MKIGETLRGIDKKLYVNNYRIMIYGRKNSEMGSKLISAMNNLMKLVLGTVSFSNA